MRSRAIRAVVCLAAASVLLGAADVSAQTPRRPNILVIWGDDVGYWNVSAYNHGMMGYKTPNIDRIAREGGMFTDWYGQQSCTAGRASFITGQVGFRTGMLKVGLPGAKEGLQARDVTIAEVLKAQGYATGQFGKNHLGDLDEHLPTAHGFDVFFGSLYHLNAEDEPEHPDYFRDPEMRKRFATRGVIRSSADGKVASTGPLNKKRMETVDDEFTTAALSWMETQAKGTSRSSCGGTRRACTSGRASRRSRRARRVWASTRTAWWSTTRTSASCSRRSTTWASPTTPS
jgi:arylsulfatase